MDGRYTQLYVHLVWATWDRLPLITAAIEPPLFAAIAGKCHALKCPALAIGGYRDHVHVLAQLHPTIAVATLIKDLKGASSHLITHQVAGTDFFKWQGGYGAFTLRREDIPTVVQYIRRQKEHHAANKVRADWELPPSVAPGSGAPGG